MTIDSEDLKDLFRESQNYTIPKRYRSDDQDIEDNELLIYQGGNGDWYLSIVKTGEKLGPSIRITTSGSRKPNAPKHIRRFYENI